jgi:hypothetical protein
MIRRSTSRADTEAPVSMGKRSRSVREQFSRLPCAFELRATYARNAEGL